MMRWKFLFVGMLAGLLVGCGSEGEEGDACESDDDCGDGLHCHIEDGGGVCEGEHDEHEEHEEEM